MTMPYARTGSTSLVHAASDGKHRPASHPVRRTVTETRLLPRDEWFQALGERIRTRRIEAGWSQTRLGTALGVSHVCIHQWERAQRHPDAWAIERIVRLLGEVRP